MLRDQPKLRRELGNNGRVAFLQKYNWRLMEEKLLNVYEYLFCSDTQPSNKFKPRFVFY
jgi:glycosyltransferase involved in cell wall biosynthesis